MITFTIALILLILGYIIYGKYISKVFGENPARKTPALGKTDGVDYVPMPTWKIFMIQFLNIAGIGPIFGAIMGAKFGTASYLWIVFGTIFAGAVHDYFSGMLSVRNEGASLPKIIGLSMGDGFRKLMNVFMLILLVLVGVVFISTPATILQELTKGVFSIYFWIVLIFAYYIIATLFPVDKIIGKIYPVFAGALLFMALGIMVMLFVKHPALPEIWQVFPDNHEKSPIFPMLCITIACGAISGFHGTQSPIMARCITNEKYGRPVFYGAMVAEGIIALVWAAGATTYYQANGYSGNPAVICAEISRSWLGKVGSILAILGVVAAPISSGDTALRSTRLIIADALGIEQKKISKRLAICIPLFIVTAGILVFSLMNKNGFDIVWRYFSWSNQVTAAITLWGITLWLFQSRKNMYITLIPALFMSYIVVCFILMAPTGAYIPGHGLSATFSHIGAGISTMAILFVFITYVQKHRKQALR